MDTMRDHLLVLSEELVKPDPDHKKVKQLAKKVDIPYSDDPFIMTNEILKKLHDFEIIT